MFFFNREVDNPVLQVVIGLGALIFAIAVIALVLVIVLPVVGAVLTGALLVVAVALLVVLLVVPLVSFFGVLLSNRRKGSGVEKSIVVDVPSFHSVKVSGAVQLDIVTGKPQSVTITTDDNLVELVKTVVENGELAVSFSKVFSTSTGFRVQITMEELKKLKLAGAVKAQLSNLDSDELFIKGSGAVKVMASGICRKAEIKLSGAGSIDAEELVSETLCIKIAGACKAVVHTTQEIEVKISGSGRVVCYGNPPSVRKHISGAGRVEIRE